MQKVMELKDKNNQNSSELLRLISLVDDPDYLDSCMKYLTTLQRDLIEILHHSDHAKSINEIRNQIIFGCYTFIVAEGSIPTNEDKFYIPTNLHLSNKELKEIAIKLKTVDQKNLSHNDFMRSINQKLSGKVELPSYKTLFDALEDMFSMGLVLKRKTKSKRGLKSSKTNYLWCLNPKLDYQLKKLKKKLK